ncbi:hypothetical protein QR680_003818 [Steinernema hermaphroditum]|uniref:RING-CH-type domain-containing protein n=1 Tax=Steinernema hermaphroditum TaxID=289476 RepID=A0AA39HLN7_9BILA|nr:hypothetical protein QR680_003818 [Steinernema hermaphroditum]
MDSAEECRICYLPSSDDQPLVHPCLCRGTQKYIHESCILRFNELNPDRGLQCPVCLYHFKFDAKGPGTRIVDQLLMTLLCLVMGPVIYAKFHLMGMPENILLYSMASFFHISMFFDSIGDAQEATAQKYEKILQHGMKIANYRSEEDITDGHNSSLLSRLEEWTSILYTYRAWATAILSACLFRLVLMENETFLYGMIALSFAHKFVGIAPHLVDIYRAFRGEAA